MGRLIATMIFTGLIHGLLFFALRRGAPVWWANRWVRRAYGALLALAGVSFVMRTVGPKADLGWLSELGITLTGSSIVLCVVTLLAMVPAVLILRLGKAAKTTTEAPEAPPVEAEATHDHDERQQAQATSGLTRREVVQWSAGAFPATALSLGGTGLVQAGLTPAVYETEFYFEDLPPDLDGVRILHLSDVHIGYSVGVGDLEKVLVEAAKLKPDVTLVTGDLCDDLHEFPATLRTLAAHAPRYGTFASIGNHEYFRGFSKVLNIYNASDVPLLIDGCTTVKIGEATLCLAGADDPVALSAATPEFFAETLDAALKDQPSEAFTVLLSHRPKAFLEATKRNVDLTLSGHTHGGQLGFAGRSAFDAVTEEQFLWGHYQQGKSQLYTSSGTGHWFPFRLGCHAEAPVIVLRRGKPRLARLTPLNKDQWENPGLVDRFGRPIASQGLRRS